MRNFDIIYRVQKGDTLALVSSKFGLPPNIIANDNNYSGELYEGQRLVIGNITGTIYIVKPSDTLESIANNFGITKEKILKDNNTEIIYPFMTIIINK